MLNSDYYLWQDKNESNAGSTAKNLDIYAVIRAEKEDSTGCF